MYVHIADHTVVNNFVSTSYRVIYLKSNTSTFEWNIMAEGGNGVNDLGKITEVDGEPISDDDTEGSSNAVTPFFSVNTLANFPKTIKGIFTSAVKWQKQSNKHDENLMKMRMEHLDKIREDEKLYEEERMKEFERRRYEREQTKITMMEREESYRRRIREELRMSQSTHSNEYVAGPSEQEYSSKKNEDQENDVDKRRFS